MAEQVPAGAAGGSRPEAAAVVGRAAEAPGAERVADTMAAAARSPAIPPEVAVAAAVAEAAEAAVAAAVAAAAVDRESLEWHRRVRRAGGRSRVALARRAVVPVRRRTGLARLPWGPAARRRVGWAEAPAAQRRLPVHWEPLGETTQPPAAHTPDKRTAALAAEFGDRSWCSGKSSSIGFSPSDRRRRLVPTDPRPREKGRVTFCRDGLRVLRTKGDSPPARSRRPAPLCRPCRCRERPPNRARR